MQFLLFLHQLGTVSEVSIALLALSHDILGVGKVVHGLVLICFGADSVSGRANIVEVYS